MPWSQEETDQDQQMFTNTPNSCQFKSNVCFNTSERRLSPVMDKTLTPVHGLPQWTTLKWTTLKNNDPNEYYLMFLAASIIKLHITLAYVHPAQPLATILNNCNLFLAVTAKNKLVRKA